jgi:hypothetical protein
VLAARADCRSAAARKFLVLADTLLCAELKEPMQDIAAGENIKDLLLLFCKHRLRRTMAGHAMRIILSYLGLPSKWHPEQCTLAEFICHTVRDVIAHVDLAAEARVKKPRKSAEDEASDEDSDCDAARHGPRMGLEIADVGGGDLGPA